MSEQLKRTRRFLEAMCVTPMRNWSGGYNWERANQLEYAVFSLLHHLESQPQTPSESLSAPTTGPAEKPLQSFSGQLRPTREYLADAPMENQAEILRLLRTAIMDCFKSTGYTLPASVMTWEDSSTLELTLQWPMASGPTKDGDRGHVVRERMFDTRCRGEWNGQRCLFDKAHAGMHEVAAGGNNHVAFYGPFFAEDGHRPMRILPVEHCGLGCPHDAHFHEFPGGGQIWCDPFLPSQSSSNRTEEVSR